MAARPGAPRAHGRGLGDTGRGDRAAGAACSTPSSPTSTANAACWTAWCRRRRCSARAAYQWPVLTNQPQPRRHLVVYAADLVRTSGGRWRVLRDLTDAPAGAGYALLNRTVLARLFPDVYRDLGVVRLGGVLRGLPGRARRAGARGPPEAARSSSPPASATPATSSTPTWPSSSATTWPRGATSPSATVGCGCARSAGWSRSTSCCGASRTPTPTPSSSATARRGVPGLLQASRLGGVGLANALGSGAAACWRCSRSSAGPAEACWASRSGSPRSRRGGAATPSSGPRCVDRFDTMVLHELPPDGEPRTLFVATSTRRSGPRCWPASGPRPHGSWPRRRSSSRPRRCCGTAGGAGHDRRPGARGARRRRRSTVLPGGLGRVLDPAVPVVTQSAGWPRTSGWSMAAAPALPTVAGPPPRRRAHAPDRPAGLAAHARRRSALLARPPRRAGRGRGPPGPGRAGPLAAGPRPARALARRGSPGRRAGLRSIRGRRPGTRRPASWSA